MLTLHYAPGACSMASHIALEEVGVPYEAKPVDFSKTEQRSEAYLRVNPRGKVPALSTDSGVLTENTAILTWIAKSFPEAKLLPADPLGEARCISMMAWFSNSVHPSFTHIVRPERFTEAEDGKDGVKAAGRRTFWANLQEIDSLVGEGPWMQGAQFTTCDPYALVFYGWGKRIELPMADLKSYTAFKDRMLQRPAVRKILEREKSVLLQA
jgi:glutathione S-transferase